MVYVSEEEERLDFNTPKLANPIHFFQPFRAQHHVIKARKFQVDGVGNMFNTYRI